MRSKAWTTLSITSFILMIGLVVWYYLKPQPSPTITIKTTPFSALPGWESTVALKSFQTFQLSCRYILKQSPHRSLGNNWFQLQAKDWQPVCKAAMEVQTPSAAGAKRFFEAWFQPFEFVNHQPITGLFTGYYLPEFPASLTPSPPYLIPIYGVPNNLIHINLKQFDPNLPPRELMGRLHHNTVLPFYSRAEINQGAIARNAQIIAYVQSPIDRLFIEIQGSGILNLPDGRQLSIGYAGKNGLPYTAIGKVLINEKKLRAGQVSMQSIRAYLESHPEQQIDVINHNQSFVFFKIMKHKAAYGSETTQLTPGYSLAVDPEWVPLGTPVWLSTTHPDPETDDQHPFNRLLIAQDTGGAIKGTVRGDVYWGSGHDAAAIAGKMKNHGRYWLLIPKAAPTLPSMAQK